MNQQMTFQQALGITKTILDSYQAAARGDEGPRVQAAFHAIVKENEQKEKSIKIITKEKAEVENDLAMAQALLSEIDKGKIKEVEGLNPDLSTNQKIAVLRMIENATESGNTKLSGFKDTIRKGDFLRAISVDLSPFSMEAEQYMLVYDLSESEASERITDG